MAADSAHTKSLKYDRLSRKPSNEFISSQDNKLSSIITQVKSDGSISSLPKLSSSFAFKWISAICSCLRPTDSDLQPQRFESSCEALLPPQSPRFSGMKTLILDLDETLVHSSFKPTPRSDILISVDIEGRSHCVYVGKRPGVDEFLARVGEKFEVVIFTASLAMYADPLIDKLDSYSVVSSRLFRESCVYSGGVYVKDLARLGRDISQVVIIDNSPTSYKFQPENAIPVLSWFDDPDDVELYKLLPTLDLLAKAKDVASFRVRMLGPHAPLTPITPEIIEDSDVPSSKETSRRQLKSVTDQSEIIEHDLDRSELNSPLHKSLSHSFKFGSEDE